MAKFTFLNGVMTKIEERKEDAVSEKFRELLKKARSINKDMTLTYDDESDQYDIILSGQVYQEGVKADDVPKALEKAGEALSKCGIVRMFTFRGFDPCNVKDQLAFSAWAAKEAHKVICTAFASDNNGVNCVVTYVPKGWCDILRRKAELEAQAQEEEEADNGYYENW